MIELIRRQISEVEDRLWDCAKIYLDVERSAETIQRALKHVDRILDGSKPILKEVSTATQFREHSEEFLALLIVMFRSLHRSNDIEYMLGQTIKVSEGFGAFKAMLKYEYDTKSNGEQSIPLMRVNEMAAALAKLRHAENYALCEEAVKHWRDNIDPKLSAQKAATELTKVVPLSHKKLAEIISAEKKKLS